MSGKSGHPELKGAAITALLNAFWQESVAARSAEPRISITVTSVRAATVVVRRDSRRAK
jgi:hypothetical protein